MIEGSHDRRSWCVTDRPGERISISRPLEGVEIMSVCGSHRHWRESHDTFTVAAVHPEQAALVAKWRTRGRSLATEAGGIMAIEPGDLHVTEKLEARRGAADFDVFHFSPALVARTAERLGLRGTFHFRSPTATDTSVFTALAGLVAATAGGEDGLTVECAGAEALTRLVISLGEAASELGRALDTERDFRLRRVKAYLKAHQDLRPTLTELEAVSGICQFRLCALFKRSCGVSVGQWWNALRLQRAVGALQAGLSIQRLVAELGYTDEAYFSRVFKSQYGITPGAWRSMFRSNDRVRRPGRAGRRIQVPDA